MCERNSTDPACPDCGAVDCEKAHRLDRECSSGFAPGCAKVCPKRGRLGCRDEEPVKHGERVGAVMRGE